MDREAWRAAVHRVTKSRTQLNDGTEPNSLKRTWTFLNGSLKNILKFSTKCTIVWEIKGNPILDTMISQAEEGFGYETIFLLESYDIVNPEFSGSCG